MRISKIASRFNITEHIAHSVILAHGNEINAVLLSHSESGYAVPTTMFEELERAECDLKDLVVDEDSVLKAAIELVPFDLSPRIYFLVDEGRIVYIGQSCQIASRVMQHKKDKRFSHVFTFVVERLNLNLVENMNIYAYNPKYNLDMWGTDDYFKAILNVAILE